MAEALSTTDNPYKKNYDVINKLAGVIYQETFMAPKGFS